MYDTKIAENLITRVNVDVHTMGVLVSYDNMLALLAEAAREGYAVGYGVNA